MADLRRVAYFKAVFPVGPGLGYHGSGVVCNDGRVLYVYANRYSSGGDDRGGAIRGVYFPSATDMAHRVSVQSNGGPHQVGVPIPDSDHVIIEGDRGGCSVWRHDGVLYLSAIYADTGGDFSIDSGRVQIWQRTELWMSPSGNGGDWVKASDIDPPRLYDGPAIYMASSASHVIGVGTPVPGGFAIPLMRWMTEGLGSALGWARPSVMVGTPGGGWSLADEHLYYLGGSYGSGVTRRVVPHAGQFWWNSHGNVERDKSSYGDGSSFTEFDSLPQTNDVDWPYTISEGGLMYRVAEDGRILWNPNPLADTWAGLGADKVQLNMGSLTSGDLIGFAGRFLWLEIEESVWALFNHDKVWFVFGGWLLGALGRS